MKLCVFSDIHGNLPAFEAAYPLIMREAADLNIFLGDLCGYYFEEDLIWEKLSKMPRLVAIRGNHDDMFIHGAEGDQNILHMYASRYGRALELFLRKDYQEMLRWMKGLPASYADSGSRFLCCHGSPRDPVEEYVYPDAPLAPFVNMNFDICFLGHTHYPMVRDCEGRMFVNPGSIGQPRDGDWPCFAVVNLKEKEVVLKHFRYDTQKVLRKINEVGDQTKYLKDVIERMGSHG